MSKMLALRNMTSIKWDVTEKPKRRMTVRIHLWHLSSPIFQFPIVSRNTDKIIFNPRWRINTRNFANAGILFISIDFATLAFILITHQLFGRGQRFVGSGLFRRVWLTSSYSRFLCGLFAAFSENTKTRKSMKQFSHS